MKTKLLKVLPIIGLVISISCSAQNETESVYEVSVDDVSAKLEYLTTDDLQGRMTGSEGIDEAATYIEEHFSELGLESFFETYRDSFAVNDLDGFNIVGMLPGNDANLKDEYIIVGAHYDHIGKAKVVNGDSIANGANDNASGTVAVMELANYFAKEKTNGRSILFALFSAEEMGLKGSAHLAETLSEMGTNVYTVFNIEMIGVPMKAKDYTAYITGYEMSNFAEKFNEYSGSRVLGFLPQAQQMNLFQRSDNYPFYKEMNIPAQTICTFDFSNYQYYHHVDDEFEELDPQHMANVIQQLIPGLEEMSKTAQKEIKLSE